MNTLLAPIIATILFFAQIGFAIYLTKQNDNVAILLGCAVGVTAWVWLTLLIWIMNHSGWLF